MFRTAERTRIVEQSRCATLALSVGRGGRTRAHDQDGREEDEATSMTSTSFPSDLEIARAATAKPLTEIASEMGIGEHLLEPYGSSLAKIRLEAIDELSDRPKAKYVVVTAITP